MENWLPFALVTPAFMGAVTIFDKLAVDRTIHPLRWPFYVGCAEIGIWVILGSALLTANLIVPSSVIDTVHGLEVGILRGITLILLVKALRTGNVSNVNAIWAVNPIFVALIASMFLGETISRTGWAAILLAVVGVFSVCWSDGNRLKRFMNASIIMLTVASAFTWGASNLISKIVLTDYNIWYVYVVSRFGLSATLLSLGIFKDIRAHVSTDRKDQYLLAIFVGAELLANTGLVMNFLAIKLGPVSLVSTISSIQPVLVLIYSVVLSLVVPRKFGSWVNPRRLLPQVLGILCIVSSIIWIALI